MATAPGRRAFGAAVAAFDIDGNPGDEMFVGNPDATVGGTTKAGQVTSTPGATMTLLAPTAFPNPLAEHDPGRPRLRIGHRRHDVLSRQRRRGGADGGAPAAG